MSIAALRKMATVRQTMVADLTESFLPAERSADQAAIAGYQTMALALAKRDEAGLALTTGEAALRELDAACRHAFEAQAAFRRVHALWPTIGEEHGNLFAPECPAPEGRAAGLHLVD